MEKISIFEGNVQESKEWLLKEFLQISASTVSASALDNIMVNLHNFNMSISQIATVSSDGKRTLLITVWDVNNTLPIAKAIEEADFGVSLSTASNSVRVIFPELTEESRKNIAALAKAKAEEAKVSIRKKREEFLNAVKKAAPSEVSEDEKYAIKEKIQKITEESSKYIDEALQKKTASIFEI